MSGLSWIQYEETFLKTFGNNRKKLLARFEAEVGASRSIKQTPFDTGKDPLDIFVTPMNYCQLAYLKNISKIDARGQIQSLQNGVDL